MEKADALDMFRRWMSREAPRTFKARPYVAAWLAGISATEEFLEANRGWMIGEGLVKASGSWWPGYLAVSGAIEITRGKISDISLPCAEEYVVARDNPKKKLRAIVPHPEYSKWLAEEERKVDREIKAEYYQDRIVEVYEKEVDAEEERMNNGHNEALEN